MRTRRTHPGLRTSIAGTLLLVAAAGLIGDQASKAWAARRAVEPRVLVPGHLAAVLVPNPGIPLGYGRDSGLTAPAFGLLGFGWVAWLARSGYRDRRRWGRVDALACGLLLAGIVGNTADRLLLGYVRDFLVTAAAPHLIFNISDLYLAAGALVLVLARIYGDWSDRVAARAA